MPQMISAQEANDRTKVRQGGSVSAEVQFCLDMEIGGAAEFTPDEYNVVDVKKATLPSRLSSISANKSYKFKTFHTKDADGRIGLVVMKVARDGAAVVEDEDEDE